MNLKTGFSVKYLHVKRNKVHRVSDKYLKLNIYFIALQNKPSFK